MTAVVAGTPRDRSPNPFAFNVSQLGPASGRTGGHHHRSISTSSTASSSSVSSLPYPLVPNSQAPHPISTSLPGLSTSQNTTPASAFSGQYVQSPTSVWPQQQNDARSTSRPNTSSSLAAELHGMDLNAFGPSYGSLPLDGSGYTGGDNFGFSSFDPSSNFNQTFDLMGFGAAFDPSLPFDPTSSSFISQLQGMDSSDSSSNYTTSLSLSGSSSSGSPNIGVEGGELGGCFNPGSLSSSAMAFDPGQFEFGGGGTGAGATVSSQPAAAVMPGFHQAQTPMAASGFGLSQSTPQDQATGYGMGSMPSVGGQSLGFGTNSSSGLSSSDQSALHHPQQQLPSSAPGFGDPMTSNSNILSTGYPATASSPFLARQHSGNTPQVQQTTTTSPSMAFGSTWARTPQPHHPSETLATTGAARPSMGQGSQASSSLLPMGVQPPPSAGGAAAGRYFTPGVRVGAQAEELASSLSPMGTSRTTTTSGQQGLGQAGVSGSGRSPSASSRVVDSPLGEAAPAPSLSGIRRSNPSQPDQQQPQMPSHSQLQPPQDPVSSQFLQFHRSQSFNLPQMMQHGRSRSDTITPMSRSSTLDYSSLVKWNSGDVLASLDMSEDVEGVDESVTANTGQWRTLSPSTRMMLENPDPLEPFFNTVQERNLVRSESLVVVPPL